MIYLSVNQLELSQIFKRSLILNGSRIRVGQIKILDSNKLLMGVSIMAINIV